MISNWERPSVFKFDILLFLTTQALIIVGILFIYSSGIEIIDGVVQNTGGQYLKQILWAITGNILLVLMMSLNYQSLKPLTPWLFFAMVVVLFLTARFGRVINGSRSWFGLANLGIQPSEIAKLITVLGLAYYFDKKRKAIRDIRVFFMGLFITLIPVALVLLQPDMGTALVYFPLFLTIYYVAGGRLAYLAYFIVLGVLGVIFTIYPYYTTFIAQQNSQLRFILTDTRALILVSASLGAILILTLVGFFLTRKFYFFLLGILSSLLGFSYFLSFVARRVFLNYQIMRLIIFLDPQIDPRGAGWNIIQSLTAVGSGGLIGKGYLKGTQSQYQYLPEQSTDFIFSIISEEIGFWGNLFVIGLFTILFCRILRIILKSSDFYGALIAAGILGMISFHFFANIGMTIGLLPVMGIPLLLLSYGGSSLWTVLLSIGLLLSINQRRYQN